MNILRAERAKKFLLKTRNSAYVCCELWQLATLMNRASDVVATIKFGAFQTIAESVEIMSCNGVFTADWGCTLLSNGRPKGCRKKTA